jgi:putative FmdB family regulatory protein
MPLYEYRCQACHERFDRTESITDHGTSAAGRLKCPKCGSRSVEAVFSPFFAKTIRKS